MNICSNRILLRAAYIILLIGIKFTLVAQVDRVEPPSWWTDMNHPGLQLLVHGENIAGADVVINYPGISVCNVITAENPEYLFVDLLLSDEVIPGSFEIVFKKDNIQIAGYNYTLYEREEGSAERKGFDNSDVMYLIMPDRFANGDPSNDEIEGMKEGADRKSNYGRHGGDLKGISDHLDYISSMGFTSIWLNPVLENDMESWSYHGYAATDFYRVDRRFGSNEEYRELGLKAREMGIKMIMDMIFNHCGSSHWWMNNPPFKNWINNYPDYKITSHRRTVNVDPHASETDRRGMVDGWFVPTMPDLNQRNTYMATYLIQNSIWWIEYASLAGIRMDTYPYPDKEMMAEWNRRVLGEYPDFSIVGEEWSLNPGLVSYWQRGQTNTDGYDGMVPSMMDFPLQSAVAKGLTEKEDFSSGLVTIYEMLSNDFLYPAPGDLVIFPDNHDMPRFYMQLGMDDDLFRLGLTFFLTTRGVPQIFYGTEILMTHKEGNDHGNIRKDFPGGWSGDKTDGFTGAGLDKNAIEMQEYLRKLMIYRKNCEALHSGMLTHFAPEKGSYVYFRHNDETIVMVVLNKNKKTADLDMSRFIEVTGDRSQALNIITGEQFEINGTLRVPPVSPLIIELKK